MMAGLITCLDLDFQRLKPCSRSSLIKRLSIIWSIPQELHSYGAKQYFENLDFTIRVLIILDIRLALLHIEQVLHVKLQT